MKKTTNYILLLLGAVAAFLVYRLSKKDEDTVAPTDTNTGNIAAPPSVPPPPFPEYPPDPTFPDLPETPDDPGEVTNEDGEVPPSTTETIVEDTSSENMEFVLPNIQVRVISDYHMAHNVTSVTIFALLPVNVTLKALLGVAAYEDEIYSCLNGPVTMQFTIPNGTYPYYTTPRKPGYYNPENGTLKELFTDPNWYAMHEGNYTGQSYNFVPDVTGQGAIFAIGQMGTEVPDLQFGLKFSGSGLEWIYTYHVQDTGVYDPINRQNCLL